MNVCCITSAVTFLGVLVVITFDVLLVLRNDFLGILPSEEKPLGSVSQIMIFVGQILRKAGDFRWRQSMSEGTEQSFLGRILIPIEAMTGCENIVIKLHHRQHRGMEEIDVLLNGRRCQFEDSESEKGKPNVDKGRVVTETFTLTT